MKHKGKFINYTLHQLRIFLAVVEHQSVTRAAETLALTQPAVSIQLKNLQEQLDIPLTEKVGRQLYITPFGEEIADVCRRILAANQEIQQTVDQYHGLLSGHIHFSVVSTGKYVMPYFLSAFVSRYPEVNVRMDVTNKNQVVSDLTQNQTDFALVSVLPENLDLEIIPLMQNHLFLVGNKAGSQQFKDRIIRPKMIEKLPLIFREKGSATRQAMEHFITTHDIPSRQTLSLTSNEAVKQAVNAGLGFSIMPLIGLRNELLNDQVDLIKVKDLPITTNWTLVYRKGKKLSPAARAYLEYVQEEKENVIQTHFAWTDAFV